MAKIPMLPSATGGDKQSVSPSLPYDLSRVDPEVGASIAQVRTEIDDAFADMRTFYTREPDEIMRLCRGHSARLSELRVRILRIEDFRREWKQVREREIEKTLDELSVQWQNASRLHAVRELDWKMEQGLS